jgi:hypothetical protein
VSVYVSWMIVCCAFFSCAVELATAEVSRGLLPRLNWLLVSLLYLNTFYSKQRQNAEAEAGVVSRD